jgi:hypothetical protein
MRKMFRMKYESCSGQCYAYSDVMKIQNLGLDEQGAVTFLTRLLEMHRPSCGNPHLAFRLDNDEELNVFVASFERYGSLDLFGGRTAKEAMDKLIDAALAYYQTDEYKELVAAKPGQGHGACHHGDDEKLIRFAITFSGLSPEAQDGLRHRFGVS